MCVSYCYGANLAIQFADIDYVDNHEDGASNIAKINQITFQTNSEPLDDLEIEEEG